MFSKSALVASLSFVATLGAGPTVSAEATSVEDALRNTDPQVTAWRRDLHEHPELGNREFRTSKLVAATLKKLGLEVQTGIAHTGVAGLLKGGKPGPTLALRADMDGLPVTEKTDVPFKSVATDTYRGDKVGVMHACGHDTHTAMLLGVAQALTQVKADLAGNVLFIFQPAEEGPPDGEEGGAQLMLKEGLFDTYKPEAIFGLHVWSGLNVGDIGFRLGPEMAGADTFSIVVKGRQVHGSQPWKGIDPIVTSAQIIDALQTIVSRRLNITATPVVVTVGAIRGGVRANIIPASTEMVGTVRTFTKDHRDQVIAEMKRIVEGIAAANGTTAELTMQAPSYPVTANDPELGRRMLPTLERVVGKAHLKEIPLVTGAEDFSFYGQKVPSLFFFVGVTPTDKDAAQAPTNHSEFFYVDEAALPIGTRAMTELVIDYLGSKS